MTETEDNTPRKPKVSISRQIDAINALLRYRERGMGKSVPKSQQDLIADDAQHAIDTLAWVSRNADLIRQVAEKSKEPSL